MRRKYIKLRAKEIIALAEDLISKKDYENLLFLENEIQFRRKTAKLLSPTLANIKDALKNKNEIIEEVHKLSKKVQNKIKENNDIDEKLELKSKKINIESNEEKIEIDLDIDERTEPEIKTTGNTKIDIHKIRPSSIDLIDTPNAWIPKIIDRGIKGISSDEFEKKSWSEKFYYSLDDLISELKKTGSTQSIEVLPGKLIQENDIDSDGYLYLFPTKTSAEEIFENAKVYLTISNVRLEGRIAGITLGNKSSIQIKTEKYLGEKTEGGRIFIDDTAMYESLRDLIGAEIGLKKSSDKTKGSIALGLNFPFAEKLIKNEYEFIEESLEKFNYQKEEQLNNSQINFIENVIKTDISYLWGPPGTGKTKTLAFLINYFCQKNERTLICSNTNMAVDQVILKCSLEKNNKFIKDGKIVRIGKVFNEELNNNYYQDVTIDGISEKRSKELLEEKSALMNKRQKLEINNEKFLEIYNRFLETDRLISKQKQILKKGKDEESEAQYNEEQINIISLKIDKLIEKYNIRKNGGGGLRGLIGRSPETLKKDIEKNKIKILNFKEILDKNNLKIKSLLEKNHELKKLIEKNKNELKNYDRSEINNKNKGIVNEINDINAKIQIIENDIEDVKQVVINEARVIGTTLTKTYLKASDLNTFENVIIDEASMCMLPAIFLAGSLSEKRIIICGDFSQLSPICKTNNLAVKKILGNNIFDVANVIDLKNQNIRSDNLSMLDTQYRMNPSICSLISDFMYDNLLLSGKLNSDKILNSSILQSFPLTIIDTSTMIPFSSITNTGSKINPLNALVARNLIKELNKSDPEFSIGYCVPFKGQAKLLRAITSKDLLENISAGTVHSFQGDEKDIIIYDTVEAISNNFSLGPFLTATHKWSEGAKLLNVAISRAKEHLIFIADLATLDKKLPNNSFLRNVLFTCQKQGNVIDARSIVNLTSIGEELAKSYFQPSSINFELPNTGHVNEDQFFPLLYQDLNNAEEAIIIFSGFFTPKRIEEIIPILQDRISKGVVIKFVLPSNDTNGSFGKAQPEACEKVIKRLRSMGIVIDQRVRLHQKAVLIDSDIIWHGSLNPLSYGGRTLESMMTCREKGVALQLAENLALKSTSKRNSIRQWAEKENPECPICKKATISAKSKYGFYFPCEDKKCSGKATIKRF